MYLFSFDYHFIYSSIHLSLLFITSLPTHCHHLISHFIHFYFVSSFSSITNTLSHFLLPSSQISHRIISYHKHHKHRITTQHNTTQHNTTQHIISHHHITSPHHIISPQLVCLSPHLHYATACHRGGGEWADGVKEMVWMVWMRVM